MSEDKDELTDLTAEPAEAGNEAHSNYHPDTGSHDSITHHLSKMYQSWFLDYASYVILERAVPHINDGLKPVQRRILHSMKRMDDGRYNKVANIVGHTMQFHPHGDASIGDALVQMGQKELLIDCQGNWGNILTGDSAAAPRYIEARLSKFALDVVFNPKTTEWKLSYDGRNKEPVTLPVKFPPPAGARSGRHRRGIVFENHAAQLQRNLRRGRQLPARRTFPTLSRLPDGGQHRREPVQRRATRRSGQGARQNHQDRQQDAGHPRNPVRQDHHDAHRLHPESHRERKNQSAQGGGQHRRGGGNPGAPHTGRKARTRPSTRFMPSRTAK